MKKTRLIHFVSAAVAFIILAASVHIAAFAANDDAFAVLNATMKQLAINVPEPKFGTGGGEWTVLSLARGGYFETDSKYFADYYDRIVDTVKITADETGALHSRKYTENSRLIMALSAIGKNPTDVGGIDIVAPLNNYEKTVWQGINGPIFALIALDTNDYETEDAAVRQRYVDYILNKELSGGGWALSGTSADPDITAMALQALVNYSDQPAVAAASDRAFERLSAMQKDNGGYVSWGSVNAESIAQVIVACCAWNIDPATDGRFVKNGNSAIDALLDFYIEDDAAFCHVAGGAANGMATDQACYALVAYDRFVNGRSSLYDMTDVNMLSGDVNFDGAVNLKDVNLLKRTVLGCCSLSRKERKAGDINGDGSITTKDIYLLKRDHILS